MKRGAASNENPFLLRLSDIRIPIAVYQLCDAGHRKLTCPETFYLSLKILSRTKVAKSTHKSISERFNQETVVIIAGVLKLGCHSNGAVN